MKNIKPILQYLKGKWNQIFVFSLFNLLSVIFSMLSLGMLVPFMKLLFGKEELLTTKPTFSFTKTGLTDFFKYWQSQLIISHHNDKLWGLIFLCFVVLSCIILKNLFLYLAKYIMNPLRNSIVRNIRSELFEKIINLPISYFTNERKGDIISRLTNDVKEIEDSVSAVTDLLFNAPIIVLFYLSILFYLSPQLCLFLAIFLPLAGWVIGKISKRLKRQSTQTQEYLSNMVSIVDETIGGLRIIKAFGAEKLQEIKFVKQNNALNRLNNSIAMRRELASPLSETMGVFVMCIILFVGGKMIFSKTPIIDSDTLIYFILIFTQLLDPLKKLSQLFYNIQKGKASIERVDSILQTENKIIDIANPITISDLKTGIEFKNVNFAYEQKPILKNINLVIPKGKTVALVGASGSGKSTLVDLIPRFHDIASGELLIDGQDIRNYKISNIRRMISVVSQEPILFNDSIKNNICLSETNASIAEIENAAQIANAIGFIQNKAEGYETNIGERGNKLSGGEKQRLTIARAILKNPDILILDEATSSLDTASERAVQDAINNATLNRTCIVIAHRLSTVQNAHKIVVMDKGEIVETGTHAELLANNSYYKRLVEMQELK